MVESRVIPNFLLAPLFLFPWAAYPFLYLPLNFSLPQKVGWGAWTALGTWALYHYQIPYHSMVVNFAAWGLLLSSMITLIFVAIGQMNFKPMMNLIGTQSKEHEAIQYFKQINEIGETPVVETEDFILDHQEHLVWEENAHYLELSPSGFSRSRSRTYSGFLSGYISRTETKRDTTETFKETSRGKVYITNKRILFLGDKRSLDQNLGNIIKVDVNSSAVTVHIRGRAKPIALQVRNPYIWEGWQRFLKVANLRSRIIPQEYIGSQR